MINRLLTDARGQRVTVLVNDFGDIAIDEALIDIRDDNLIALANGCMCCQIGGDLFNAIDRILERRGEIDHLVIEASGVAFPGKIGQIAVAEPDLDLARIVTVVDAAHLRDTLADPLLQDTVIRQLSDADLLLISKADLVDETELGAVVDLIGSLAPQTPVMRSVFGDVADGNLFASRGNATGDAPPPRTAHRHDRHEVPFRAWSWTGAEAVGDAALREFLDRDDLGIYRAKGLMLTDAGTSVVVQKVGRDWTVTPAKTVAGDSRLVAIGTPPAFREDRLTQAWRSTLQRRAGD